MTPEERANNTVKDVANVIGGFANTTARDVIAAVIRDAVAAERERCLAIAREGLRREGESGQGECDWVAARIREGT